MSRICYNGLVDIGVGGTIRVEFKVLLAQDFDMYNGKDPKSMPMYRASEAAFCLGMPVSTVRSWMFGRGYPTRAGQANFEPLFLKADPVGNLLSFNNLLEIHVLGSLRKLRKVELQSVRRAIEYLKDRIGSEHPLLEPTMSTDGKDLFIERYGQLVNISRYGQTEMKEILSIYLERIHRDQWGVPLRLFPFTRIQYHKSPFHVSIDPRVKFGRPCVDRTMIPTAIIAGRHMAGDSIAFLAQDYARTTEEIDESIRYESRTAS